jgi:hypothetical protein
MIVGWSGNDLPLVCWLLFFFEELEFVFFFSRENCSTKESVESKGNLANFFAAEFGQTSFLYGVSQESISS